MAATTYLVTHWERQGERPQAGLKPRAKVRMCAVIGEPTIMLTGPTPACRAAGAHAGQRHRPVGNQRAFATVPMKTARDLGVSLDRVNVNGAIAMGHPLGATGALILGTALDELRAHRQVHLASLCIGAGMGIATIIERV